MTTQTTAILYLRAARESDTEIVEQHRLCTDYADARGWRVVDVVVDNGVDGLGDALGMTALRDRIAGGEVQAIISTTPSRISGDHEISRVFGRFCRDHGTDLCFAEPPVSMDSLLQVIRGAQTADTDTNHDTKDDGETPFKAAEFRL